MATHASVAVKDLPRTRDTSGWGVMAGGKFVPLPEDLAKRTAAYCGLKLVQP